MSMGETITLDPTTDKLFCNFLSVQCSGSPVNGREFRLAPTDTKHSQLERRLQRMFEHVSFDPLGAKFKVRYKGRPLDVTIGFDADYSFSKSPIKIKGIRFKIGF